MKLGLPVARELSEMVIQVNGVISHAILFRNPIQAQLFL